MEECQQTDVRRRKLDQNYEAENDRVLISIGDVRQKIIQHSQSLTRRYHSLFGAPMVGLLESPQFRLGKQRKWRNRP